MLLLIVTERHLAPMCTMQQFFSLRPLDSEVIHSGAELGDVLLNLNHGFISYVINVSPRAFMMCAVTPIEFASEPLGVFVIGHATGR